LIFSGASFMLQSHENAYPKPIPPDFILVVERWYLSLELIALRHQVEVLKRSGKRPQFSSSDRCFVYFRRASVNFSLQSPTVFLK
jgi:hypothetical protein